MKKGFTLIEVMLVIAIIGILGTVLFPSAVRYMASARDTNRITDIRLLADVFQTYRTVNESLPDNSTGVTWSYCASEIIWWPNVGTIKDKQYTELWGNFTITPWDKNMASPLYPCTQTWSYFYNRLTDAGGIHYGIFAAKMETSDNITYLTGSDFTGSTNILKIMQATKIQWIDVLTLSGLLTPIYHVVIY